MIMPEDLRAKGYKLISFVFKHESAIRIAVLEARNTSRKVEGGGHTAGNVSDPTGQTAIRNVTPLEFVTIDGERVLYPEKWLEVIDLTYANTRDEEKNVMRMYHKGYTAESIEAMGVGYQARTVYYILSSFRQLAAEIACQMGLIKVVAA
jgi:hypothetical protein